MKFNFCKNKFKQFVMLFISVILLFIISYSNFHTNINKKTENLSSVNLINNKKASPKELFLDCYYTAKNNYYLSDLNHQNWSRWKKRYINKLETLEDAYVAINSMLASLDDPYSRFLTQEEFLNQNNAINSKLYGIGINIASNSGKIYITNVLEGTSAYKSGIMSGDIILKINDTDISGKSIYQVSQLIKGENNENIELELLRGTKKIVKSPKKEEIKIKTIEYKKLDNDLGYIRISSFVGIDTPKDFIIALNRLKDSKALILDLRGNAGGLFQNALVISNLFMDKGTIVNVIARQNKKNTYNVEHEGCIYNNPVVVLIDNDSASASEILSSALKDNNRATLIGTRTYGKGLVQKIYPQANKTGMNLTIARYLTPNGVDINSKGIEPDYKINFTHNDFINNFDPQLAYAQEYLERQIKK